MAVDVEPHDADRARSRRRVVLALLVGLAGVVAVVAVIARPGSPDRLPTLEGESVVDGSPLSTERFDGDVLVINAWATWCVPCRTEQPALLRVLGRYRGRGVSFLGIDHLDDRAAAKHWIDVEFKVPYPSLFDPSGSFAAELGYPGLPATFVVDRSGVIRFRHYGPITEQDLSEALDDVLVSVSSR